MNRPDVIKMAEMAKKIVFDYDVEVEIDFRTSRQRRFLKQGFVNLVPKATAFTTRRIRIYFNEKWLTNPAEATANYLVHELLHAKQMLEMKLRQDDKGVITHQNEDYWYHYNVHYGRHVVCKKGSHQPLLFLPWEEEVVFAQRCIVPIMMRRWSRVK